MSNIDGAEAYSPWEIARLERAQMGIGLVTLAGVKVDRASLASDLVLYGDDLDGIARSYGASPDEMQALVDSDAVLRREMADIEKAVKEIGRPQLRARDVFCEGIPMFAQIMSDASKPLEMRLRIWTLMAKVGGIIDGGPGARAEKNTVNVALPRDLLEVPDSVLQVIVRSGSAMKAPGPVIEG